jgi:hypothetical protein
MGFKTAMAGGIVLMALLLFAVAQWRTSGGRTERVEHPVANTEPAQPSAERVVEALDGSAPRQPAPNRPDLLLVSTASAEESADSIATFLVRKAGTLRAARPGDDVADAAVLEWVEPDRAGLRRDEDRWTLALSALPAEAIASRESNRALPSAPGSDDDAAMAGNRPILEMFREEPGRLNRVNLLTEAAIAFRFDEEDGDILGMTLDSLSRDGVYAQLGLRSGDVLLAVNGIEIDSPEAGETALGEIENAPRLRILLQRAERTEEVVVERILTADADARAAGEARN